MFDTSVSLDDLEQHLIGAQSEIDRLRASQSVILRHLDTAQVAHADGARTLTDWVAARLDIPHERARELVAAARTMSNEICGEVESGEIGFDRALAETRLAAAGASEPAVLRSRGLDLAGVRRLCARHRRMTPLDEEASFLEQYVVIQPSLDEAQWRLWGQLAGVEGRIVEKAIQQRADEITDDGLRPATGLRSALALTTICQDSLDPVVVDGDTRAGAVPIVAVTVDATLAAETRGEAGAEIVAGPRIGPNTLDELICLGKIEWNLFTLVGEYVPMGAATKRIPDRYRRQILARDGGCTVEGCHSRYRPEVHHIVERSCGGTDDATNLATVCWYHHHVVIHQRGFRFNPSSPPGRRRLVPPGDPPQG